MTNIIADVAGEYNTLLKLIDQMPPGEFIFLGDLIDRGPDSKKVIDYVMKNKYRCVLGNHEHMMLDFCINGGFYGHGRHPWLFNGGTATLKSFDPENKIESRRKVIPVKYLEWVANLPRYIEIDRTLISHAFLRHAALDDALMLKEACDFGNTIYDKEEMTIIWNRGQPVRRDRWDLQVCGHNSQFGLREWRDDQGLYAICLDDCRKKKLTGLHLETMQVYQEDYVDS